QPPAFAALVRIAGRDPLVENIEISSGREMPQAAADDDGAAARVPGGLDLRHDRVDELRSEQIIGSIDHGQDSDIAALLPRHQRIFGQADLPLCRCSDPSRPCLTAYLMTCILQVIRTKLIESETAVDLSRF